MGERIPHHTAITTYLQYTPLAVRTLLDWHHAGENVDRRMSLLSALLGHVDPASTYWYLEAVPELLQLISRRLEQLPEVLS